MGGKNKFFLLYSIIINRYNITCILYGCMSIHYCYNRVNLTVYN